MPTDETTFRVVLGVAIVLTMSVGAYHRWQAARSGEKISHQDEGYAFAAVLRLLGLGLWLVTLGYLFYPPAVEWASIPLPYAVRWAALAGVVGSGWLMYWTMSTLGKNLTDTVVTRANATLVTTGPYRWVRHPFYVTAALVMTCVTLASANALIGGLSLLILAMLAIRTPKEEAKLVERFGDSYRQYMNTTGRFWPRWHK